MGPFEMVVGIVLIVTIGSIIRAKHGIRRDRHGNEYGLHDEQIRAENRQLREELRGLKERIAVLERLATDDTSALDREIEKLRDRNSDRV
ncbi:hypothetical protein D1610_15535 [Sphingomonas gilva]|uniref:Uncharacterized protein n=1 Tax=Sphingomonas gilva TaxID=2305907 RepID=A0A396RSE4_9SPHN|nr:hypothetical protein [Sphingomonas gilva]RHW16501.1 hypothetical protein D1610_15535 [Sphingomonas gilva]